MTIMDETISGAEIGLCTRVKQGRVHVFARVVAVRSTIRDSFDTLVSMSMLARAPISVAICMRAIRMQINQPEQLVPSEM